MINKFYLLCVIFSGSPDLTLKTCLVYLCSRTCYYLLFPITMLKCNISYYRFYTCYNNTSWYASLRNLILGNLMYAIFLRSCSFSGSQTSRNPKLNYLIRKVSSLLPLLRHMKPILALLSCFFNIYFNVFPSTPRTSKWLISSIFLYQIPVCFSLLIHRCHMSRPDCIPRITFVSNCIIRIFFFSWRYNPRRGLYFTAL